MQVTKVEDHELLFRSVRDDQSAFVIREGLLKLSSSAFNDRGMAPSVDRAELHNHNAAKSQKSPEQGVVALLTGDVRDTVVHKLDAKGAKVVATYVAEVIHRPIEENVAHSQIEANPIIEADQVFRRLKERLCVLAQQRGWIIQPQSLRQ